MAPKNLSSNHCLITHKPHLGNINWFRRNPTESLRQSHFKTLISSSVEASKDLATLDPTAILQHWLDMRTNVPSNLGDALQFHQSLFS